MEEVKMTMLDCKGDYAEKKSLFCYILWKYLGHPVNFSANPLYVYIYILYIYIYI